MAGLVKLDGPMRAIRPEKDRPDNMGGPKKNVITYPRFTKLIIADLIKKYLSIPKRLDEDYHSITDDIPLIRATDDYKEYETVFIGVEVLINQPQPIISTQGTHRTTPSIRRSPTLTASPRKKKRKKVSREKSSPRKSLKVTIKQKHVVKGDTDKRSYASKFDALMLDANKDEKMDDVGIHEMGSL
uniref:Uncharacterized protein n=1 Tax=Tanacetum cinerariifolium TaxID=118510 RepID=A0A6L2JSL7_TANCI|nr:hypothetical protein [Tanacetum cinerariifolium]